MERPPADAAVYKLFLDKKMFEFLRRKPAAPAEPAPRPPDARPLIALIEDEEDILQLLTMAMEQAGWEVAVARDGILGLELVRRRRPDLVVLDIKMPRMNGYQVLTRLHLDSTLVRIPVIVMTSQAAGEKLSDEEWARRLRVNRFISKPFSPEQMVELVREELGRPTSPQP